MTRRVINITHSANRYDILSQTPKNYSKDNYFIKELQDKVNAEWPYRPNRVDIEYENEWGKQTYSPIEVVVQSVKSEKGNAISDDCKSIVFKNILEDRFVIGSRFRFEHSFGTTNDDGSPIADKDKNVWIATNTNGAKITASMVIERCNGSLGSVYLDNQGVARYHYEPVIQGRDLTSVSLVYNEVAVSPQSQLLIIAQHNEYTKNYFINQRFIIGYDKVYRIKAINKFYGNSTFNPEDVGLMRIYLELTETSPYDDFEHRIAYQSTDELVITEEPTPVTPGEEGEESYSIIFEGPDKIPTFLDSLGIIFKPVVVDSHGNVVPNIKINLSCQLENLPSGINLFSYVDLITEGNIFKLSRKKLYLRGNLILTWNVKAEDSPNHKEFSASFKLDLRQGI